MEFTSFSRLLDYCQARGNLTIFDSFVKAKSVINKHEKIIVSISGGSDSDIVLDIIEKVRGDKDVEYVWFDTGLEYQATKDHLKYLEDRYDIKIERERAVKPIPTSCRQYGQPFISKQVSEFMSRLQRNGFEWEDAPYEVLLEKYPNCKSALKWWSNKKGRGEKKSSFDISRNKWLREFIIANPPTFSISNICCKFAKKDVSNEIIKRHKADLMVIGIRKAEGGARATAYKNCFSNNQDKGKANQYRPIFFYSNKDKEVYEHAFNIKHSECYAKYGLPRTGCAGCPYGRGFEYELDVIDKHEPKLHKACMTIFKDSYEYTRKYREFAQIKEKTVKEQIEGQTDIYDFL